MKERTISLKDGRILGYAEYGDPKGPSVILIHGMPGGRYDGRVFETHAKKHHIRLLSIERPGYGLSDVKKKYTPADFTEDLIEFLDQLGIKKFIIAPFSGGSPFGFACLKKMPERINACILLNASSPTNPKTKGVFQFIMNKLGRVYLDKNRKNPVKFKQIIEEKFIPQLKSPADQVLLKIPEVYQEVIDYFYDALKNGIEGFNNDWKTLNSDWEFLIRDLPKDIKIIQFQAEQDTSNPIQYAKEMAELIPNIESHYYPNEGALSLAINQADVIISELKKYIK